MKYTVRLSKQAQQDLREIWRGLAKFEDLSNADDRLLQIKQKFKLLEQFPNLGRSREDLFLGLRSLPAKGFIIFYRVGRMQVEILRVLDGRRDIDAILGEQEE
jgi:toxin ParE1/3/4